MRFTMRLCLIAALCLAASALPATTESENLDKRSCRTCNYDKVRGVNIGGWGVLEPWITPSIFESVDQSLGIVDEFTLTQRLSRDVASGILNAHWATFYTQADFQAIAATGINTIRIPVGYWSFVSVPGAPFIQGFEQYLDLAITWAQQCGLKVWIDLHGAPGSQNGFDNSGERGPINWPYGSNVAYTQQAIQAIITKYSVAPFAGTVVGIELLNEPNGNVIDIQTIADYYSFGINAVQKANGNMLFIIHDAFLPMSIWSTFNPVPNAVLDTHHYEVFGTTFDLQGQLYSICGLGNNITVSQGSINTVVGEWSGAQTDCTKYLNGYATGARYSGSFANAKYHGDCASTFENGEISQWTAAQRSNTRRIIEAQLDAYERGGGWIFWTAKTESSPYWDFLRLVAGGIFPQPFNTREYPYQCGY